MVPFSNGGSFVKNRCKCIANGGISAAKECFVAENLLYPVELLCSLSLVVSMEISWRQYFQSDLCICFC